MFEKQLTWSGHIIKRGIRNTGINKYLRDFIEGLVIKAQTPLMSPVDRHIYLNTFYGNTNFGANYLEWTMRRINKVLDLYGLDFFKNKRILELGGGQGISELFLRRLEQKYCL